MSRNFLVAVDGSEQSWKALDMAADMARTSGATLVILHVVAHEPLPNGASRFARSEGIDLEELAARYHSDRLMGDTVNEEAEARARRRGLVKIRTEGSEGEPAGAIVAAAAAERAEMVFLGSRGLSDIEGMLIGSVSHKVMHRADCTCIAVK